MDYIKALKAGKEIIIIAYNESFNSSIFWMENGDIYTFSRELGTIRRNTKSYPEYQLAQHFATMASEGAMIYIRG